MFVALDKLSDKPFVTKSASYVGAPDSEAEKSLRHQKSVEHYIQQDLQFRLGDRVIAFDDKGRTVAGTVKWVGSKRLSKMKVVGIETVSLHAYINICTMSYVHMLLSMQPFFKLPCKGGFIYEGSKRC